MTTKILLQRLRAGWGAMQQGRRRLRSTTGFNIPVTSQRSLLRTQIKSSETSSRGFLIRSARMIRLRHVAALLCVSLEIRPTFKRARLLDSPHLSFIHFFPPASSSLSLSSSSSFLYLIPSFMPLSTPDFLYPVHVRHLYCLFRRPWRKRQ